MDQGLGRSECQFTQMILMIQTLLADSFLLKVHGQAQGKRTLALCPGARTTNNAQSVGTLSHSGRFHAIDDSAAITRVISNLTAGSSRWLRPTGVLLRDYVPSRA